MKDQITQISEIFAAPRGDLQLVLNYGGVKIYTSNVLKQNFIKAMSKTSRVGPVIETIIKLMNKKEFIPCYLTDKVLKSLLRRQPPEFKGYSGLTLGKYILVFVDNDTNIFGFTSNNELSITTLHELIHKSSNKYPKMFFQTFKSELTLFYHFYWSKIFSLDSKKTDIKKVQEIISYIYNTSERDQRTNKQLIEYHKMLIETFGESTTLDNQIFQKIVQDYIVLIKIVWKAMDSHAPTLIEKVILANRQLITPLYTAYKTVFAINVSHMKELCYQELYAPSEVISIPALIKRPDAKVYKMINKL